MNTIKSLNWKHFVVFFLIQIVLITLTSWIGKNVNQNTIEMFYINIPLILGPPIITVIMFLTYRGQKRLNFKEKIFPLIGLLLIGFLWTLFLNYVNIFERNITQQDLQEGIQRYVIYEIVMFIICLPIIGIVKTRINEIRT